jgi:hypothetical protein
MFLRNTAAPDSLLVSVSLYIDRRRIFLLFNAHRTGRAWLGGDSGIEAGIYHLPYQESKLKNPFGCESFSQSFSSVSYDHPSLLLDLIN